MRASMAPRGPLQKQAAQSDADRETIRTVLGSELIQKLDFKN